MSDINLRRQSDGSLLQQFRTGCSDSAAEQIYLRYAGRLISFARGRMGQNLKSKIEAEDIVQSVFRTFFRRAGRGEFAVPDGAELWRLFLVVALNKIRNAAVYHRAAKRDGGREVATDASLTVTDPNSDGATQEALVILRQAVEEVIEKLEPSQQQIIRLRLAGHEVAEISMATGRAKRSVERVLQSFRTQMEQTLDDVPEESTSE